MFSAVAMIAFVGSSIANNEHIEVSNNIQKLKNASSETVFSITLEKDCGVTKFSTYVDARAAGFSHEDATNLSWKMYYFCAEHNNTSSGELKLEQQTPTL